jgi:biopolymer transport protein ExbD
MTCPHWGLFCGAVLWILIFTFMVFGPHPSKGLFVSWKKPLMIFEKSPWSEAVEVYVGPPARFFINGNPVERNQLRTKLLDQIGRRGEWTVYFEADPDTAFGDDAYALDTILACGATVVWVTPKMREEWQHKSHWSKNLLVSPGKSGYPKGSGLCVLRRFPRLRGVDALRCGSALRTSASEEHRQQRRCYGQG